MRIIKQEGSPNNDYATAVVLAGGLPVVAGSTGGNFPGMTRLGCSNNDGIVVKYSFGR